MLAAASDDMTVWLWKAAQPGKPATVLQGHAGWVACVAFAPDGKTLATGSDDLSVKLWDPDLGLERGTLGGSEGHTGMVRSVVFSPDGKTLATVAEDKVVILWRAATTAEVESK
jgi:WD40 repeat protein